MGRLSALAVAALLAGCPGGDDTPPGFHIEISLDPDEGCPSTDCAQYGMTCGALLSVRVLDAADFTLLGERCVEVEPADDVCALGEAQVADLTVPLRNARVEVAVWRPDPDAETPTCPPSEGIFDLRGVPRTDVLPQPAFGRSVVFDLGGGEEVLRVPLACGDVDQVGGAECSAEATYVRADIDDIDSLVGVTADQASDLAVFVGEPVATTDQQSGETTWSLETADAFQLEYIPPGILGFTPFFEAHLPRSFGADLCTLVTDLSAPETTSSVRCSREIPGDDPLMLKGFLVAKETVDAILAALDLSAFPVQGMLIGRVIDDAGQPLAGVMITPSEGSVAYLSADLGTTAGLTQTSSSGYFVSLGAPFNSTWSAVHLDGRREQGSYVGGVIRGRATVLLIRMTRPE